MRLLRLAVLLLALLMLAGCSSRFTLSETGYTDTETDLHYLALPSSFEAAGGGSEVGTYEDETYGRTVTFRVIPDADPTKFLTDADGFVYYAGETAPDASLWQIKSIMVCEEDAISVEKSRLIDPTLIAEIRALWFAGDEGELPLEDVVQSRRLKLTSADFPGIYYCFNLYVYEGGSAYFYDAEARRAVAVDAALAAQIPLN